LFFSVFVVLETLNNIFFSSILLEILKIIPIILKAGSAVTKRFPKAAGSPMDGDFYLFKWQSSSFQQLSETPHITTSGFRNPFRNKTGGFLQILK
jgi:hypothetical protein